MRIRCLTIVALILPAWPACCLAQTLNMPQSSFVGGETSPLLVGRHDMAQYSQSCRELENAMVVDVGAVTRRPGSVYVTAAPGAARLETFVYSADDVYVMEFSHRLLRFYRDNGIVLNGASPYTLATPWDGNDVFALRIYQKGDTLYVAHRDYSTRRIVRAGHTSWTITDCNDIIRDGPFKDENEDTAVLIDPPDDPTDATGGETFDANNVYLTYAASEAFDDAKTVDQCWIADETADTWLRCTFAAAKTITRVKIWPCGNAADTTQNVRHCKIEASNDGSTWTKLTVNRWYGRCEGYNGDEIAIDRIGNYTDYAYVKLVNTTAYTQYRIWCYDNWGHATYTRILEVEMMENGTDAFTATANIFDPNHVGSVWRIRQPRQDGAISGSMDTHTQWTNPVAIQGDWDLEITGSWAGTVTLQRSYDYGAMWQPHRTWTNPVPTVTDIGVSGDETDSNVWYRVALTDYGSGTVYYSLSTQEGLSTGIIEITGYTDANEVSATVLEEFGSTEATYRWSEGAWSAEEGYPEAVAGHMGRLVFARDLTIWWSQTPDMESFRAGENDDQAFSFSLSQSRQNPILWLVGDRGQALIAGTLGRVMEIQPMDELVGFTPSNLPKVRSTVAIGASTVAPTPAEDVLLYASFTGRRIHEMMYNSGADSINAPDLTLLASHILGTGVVQLAWQTSPYPYLWCVRIDGEMATCYYNRPFQVAAWSRLVTDGEYTSVAAVPRSANVDRVWTIVKRTINGSDVYCVEYFDDIDMEDGTGFLDSRLSYNGGAAVAIAGVTKANPGSVILESWPTGLSDGDQVRIMDVAGMTELNYGVFTADDCNQGALTLTLDIEDGSANCNTSGYTTYTGGGTLQIVENTFTGLTHLEGESVSVLADGVYVGDFTVSGGSIALDDYYAVVYAGLNYTTTVTPVEVDMMAQGGSTAPRFKKINYLMASVYNTAGGKYGASAATLKDIPWGQISGSAVNDPSHRWTGPDVWRMDTGPRRDATYTLIWDAPYPMTIRGLTPCFDVLN